MHIYGYRGLLHAHIWLQRSCTFTYMVMVTKELYCTCTYMVTKELYMQIYDYRELLHSHIQLQVLSLANLLLTKVSLYAELSTRLTEIDNFPQKQSLPRPIEVVYAEAKPRISLYINYLTETTTELNRCLNYRDSNQPSFIVLVAGKKDAQLFAQLLQCGARSFIKRQQHIYVENEELQNAVVVFILKSCTGSFAALDICVVIYLTNIMEHIH